MVSNGSSIVDFLSVGETYGLPGEVVQRIDTHAAQIFLVNNRAYKMKRNVKYSFLDFSTSEKRRATLEAELKLNRKTAPRLYRRLVAVTQTNLGQLELDGDGVAVEWLLEMERFEQSKLFENLATANELGEEQIDRLAAVVVKFHTRAEVRQSVNGYSSMAIVVADSIRELSDLSERGIVDQRLLGQIDNFTRRELSEKRSLLELRSRTGYVRRCHGDLHLGNIVELDGQPTLFDCLEFSEELASIDTFYDIAFVLMDLCHRCRRDLAQRLLNCYLDQTLDDDGCALLPLFLAVRAIIRAKVAGFRADLADESKGSRGGDAEIADCRSHLKLALEFLDDSQAELILIGGLSGTGKSTLAKHLAPLVGAAPGGVVMRSDVLRKRSFHVGIEQKLPSAAYEPPVSEMIYDKLFDRAGRLLLAGRTVIVDATFLSDVERDRFQSFASHRPVQVTGLWLEADPSILEKRITERLSDASDADVQVLAAQRSTYTVPTGWHRLNVEGTVEEAVDQALSILSQH
ncbi:MAG: AAA family ATPase [Hyphomicrobiaceae bacterium]